MATAEDVTRLLTKESNLLLFLPVANFTYIAEHANTIGPLQGGLVAVVVATILYTGGQGEIKMTRGRRIFYLIILLAWIAIMCHSMRALTQNFNREGYLPEALFFGSAIVISLIVIDTLTGLLIEEYEGVLRGV